MGIVNTFPACLESPYLVQDLDAPGQVGELMELAADRLAAATDLFESGQGDQADVTFFSYESIVLRNKNLSFLTVKAFYALFDIFTIYINTYISFVAHNLSVKTKHQSYNQRIQMYCIQFTQ